jgi:hypothetical protein
MQDRLKDILSHLSTEVDQDTLLKYLNGQLTESQKNDVEKKMMDTDFSQDAMEGLQSIQNSEKISWMVDQLNRDLHKKLDKKKQLRNKLVFKDSPWIYITIILVLLLIVISYFILHKMLQ